MIGEGITKYVITFAVGFVLRLFIPESLDLVDCGIVITPISDPLPALVQAWHSSVTKHFPALCHAAKGPQYSFHGAAFLSEYTHHAGALSTTLGIATSHLGCPYRSLLVCIISSYLCTRSSSFSLTTDDNLLHTNLQLTAVQ